jgi:hypothetical protein
MERWSCLGRHLGGMEGRIWQGVVTERSHRELYEFSKAIVKVERHINYHRGLSLTSSACTGVSYQASISWHYLDSSRCSYTFS